MAAKRLTDTGKWDQAWFRKLSPKLKAINDYLCDKCDHAGIWEIDLETLAFFVNDRTDEGSLRPVTIDEIKASFDGKVRLVRHDKLFIEGSALFQYKLKSLTELKFNNNAQLSAIRLLEKYGIIRVHYPQEGSDQSPFITIIDPLVSPSSGAHEGVSQGTYYQEQEEAKEKVQDQEQSKSNVLSFEKPSSEKTTGRIVKIPPVVTKESSLGAIAEFSDSVILAPFLTSISKEFQRQLITKHKDVAWLKSELEDCVTYYTGTKEINSANAGKLMSLWIKRSRNKPNILHTGSRQIGAFDFDPSAGGKK